MADVITTAGKNAVAEKLGGLGSHTEWTYLAIGSNGATAVVGDTTLGTELTDSGLARATGAVTTDTANVLQIVGLWTATAAKNILECGVLNKAATGTLLAHSDFSTISVASSDSIQITYKITVS